MRLGTRQALVSILPMMALGVTGIGIMISTWQKQLNDVAEEVQHDTLTTVKQLDEILFNVTRAADELAHRHEPLDEAVQATQESTLADFFKSYISNLHLNILISTDQNVVLYRSWDAQAYGDQVSSDQRGNFLPKLIPLKGSIHFAVSNPIISLEHKDLGHIMIAIKLDEKFLTALYPGFTDAVRVGTADNVIAQLGDIDASMISHRNTSKVVPGLWLELHRDVSAFRERGIRNIRTLSSLFLALAALSSIYFWYSTRKHLVQPIKSLYGVLINGQDLSTIQGLPRNEIGGLGQALLNQKVDLDQKILLVKSITDQLQKEASLLKVLSHDISTPLAVVKASAEMLRNSSSSPENTQKNLRRIQSQVETIEAILSHVKDMKALETGKRTLTLKELTFGPIITDIATTFQDRLATKKITLDWLPSDEKSLFVADQISFRVSVLSNIISNAIKFSPRDSRIEVRCREINGRTRIDVRDYGSGMPANIREHLFSTSHATTRAGSEGETGTGFGMPLVKFYVDLFGGTVEVTSKTVEESSSNHGTEISLILETKLNRSQKVAA